MNAIRKEYTISDSEYEDYLDAIYGDVTICGMSYGSGRALQELDPTAFNCGKADHESSVDEDNPTWICGDCGEEFADEDEANECCVIEEEALNEESFTP